MRLWHKNLIPVLPRQQLLGQWRECCAIARNISVKGSPNHVLVNRIMDYPLSHFYNYGKWIYWDMMRRGYKCDLSRFSHYFTFPHDMEYISFDEIFKNWHDEKYLRQCFYNLEEKHDCGAISDAEWKLIQQEVWKNVLHRCI